MMATQTIVELVTTGIHRRHAVCWAQNVVSSSSSVRSVTFEVPEGEVGKTLPVIKQVMEDAPHPAVTLSVPLAVDAKAADNWDEAH